MYKGLLIMLLGVVPALVGIEVTEYMQINEWPSYLSSSFKTLSIIMMVALMLYGANKLRCPKCNILVAGQHSRRCPKCKENLW